jgi:hypothetical protein
MVQESPSDSTTPPAQGRRLGGGAIASLSGVGLLVVFMIQNTQRVRLDFLFLDLHLAALAPHDGLRAARGAGVVRTGRDAPSPASQGAPPSPTGLTLTSARRRAGPSPRCRAQIPQLHPHKSAGQNALAGVDERGAVRGMCQLGDPHRAAALAVSDHPDGLSTH